MPKFEEGEEVGVYSHKQKRWITAKVSQILENFGGFGYHAYVVEVDGNEVKYNEGSLLKCGV